MAGTQHITAMVPVKISVLTCSQLERRNKKKSFPAAQHPLTPERKILLNRNALRTTRISFPQMNILARKVTKFGLQKLKSSNEKKI